MDYKRWVCVALCLCVLCITAFSELRNYVVIVKPVLHKTTVENFNKIAGDFEEHGYEQMAEIFRSFAKGGHGSGFVITDEKGENYIITNRHVVAQAESVNITISTYEGTDKTYENCPIIFIDDQIDLAVLQFPNKEKVFKEGFKVDTKLIKDGTEVWSAGYPGLFGRPGWQFSKGNITNQRANIPEMTDPKVSYIIQHSASIDPGNSGGPLLIRDNTSPTGYSAIGINTWTVSNRQNSFFAIPAKNIPVVLQRAKKAEQVKQNRAAYKADLEKSCKILAGELKSKQPDYNKVNQFISYSFVDKKGLESFATMLKISNSTEKEQWQQNFFFNSPVETMRSAIFILFWNSIRGAEDKTDVDFKEINFADQDNFQEKSQVRTIFNINGGQREIIWAYESGHWRVVDMDLAQVKKAYGVDTPLLGSSQPRGIGIGIDMCADVFSGNLWGNQYKFGVITDIQISSYISISTGLYWLAQFGVDFYYYPGLIELPVLVKFEYYFDLSFVGFNLGLSPFVALGPALDCQFVPLTLDLSTFFYFSIIGRAGVEIEIAPISIGIYITYNYFLAPYWFTEEPEYPLLGVFVKYNL
jgi:S1-C subfamily serine protease